MKRGIAGFLVCALLAMGCATSGTAPDGGPATRPNNVKEWLNQQSRPKKKAIVGALAGAVLGAVVADARGEDPWKGAAAGAAVGAVAGFLVGKAQDRIYASRDQAINAAQYDPSQGYVARVEEVKFDPPQPRAGETASLYVRYLVVGPDPHEDIKVRMFRGLKYGDEYVMGAGPNEFVVPKGGGIVESTMEVTLPAKAPQGSYGVEALLEDTLGRFPQAKGINSLYVGT